jgi:hypothetical protein
MSTTSSTGPLADLAEAGVAVWLDDLSRARLRSGNLADLARRGVVGVTTNPTIFHMAIAGSEVYAEQLHDLATLDCSRMGSDVAVGTSLAWADAADLGGGDHVQGAVGSPVAAAVESDLAATVARPHRDRGGADEPGVGVLGAEPMHPRGLAEDMTAAPRTRSRARPAVTVSAGGPGRAAPARDR